MSRASRSVSERIEPIEVGGIDLVSKAVYYARIPSCVAVSTETGRPCTRAAGHDENRNGHLASVHVHTDPTFLALEVWT
jgi:hypothetical protein